MRSKRALGMFVVACVGLLAGVRTSAAQSAAAATETAGEMLAAAAAQGATPALEERVRAHRLEVRPVVDAYLAAGMRASIAGDAAEAGRRYAVAQALAEAFARQFGERSLQHAVAYVEGWTAAEQARKLRADSLYEEGTALRGKRETLDQAYARYLEALQAYRALGDRLGEGAVLGGLGVVHWYAGDGDSTLHYFDQALAVRQAADDRLLVGNSLNDLGSASRVFFDDYDAALDYYLQAVAVREEIGDVVGLGKTLSYLGAVYERLGNLEQAIAYYDRAAAANDAAGDLGRAAAALTDAGVVLNNAGRYSEALGRLERALALREARGEADRVADVLNWIGVAHRRLGDYEAALANYQKVVAFAREMEDDLSLAHAYSNIGVVYLSVDRPERAADFFGRALERFEAGGDPQGALGATLNLASSLLEQRDYAGAEPRAVQALEASRAQQDRLTEGRSLALLGNVLNRSGRFEEAVARYEEALALGREMGVPDVVWNALLGLGDVSERQGDYDAAIAHYETAFQSLEETRGALNTEEEKANYLAQQRFAYEAVVDLLSRLHGSAPGEGYDDRAFRYAEQAKARAFLDLLAEALSGVREGIAPEMLQRQDALLAERTRLQQEVQALAADADAERKQLRAALDAVDEDYRSLQRVMRSENPRYSALQYPTPATLGEVQADLLAGGAVLLEYAVGDSSTTLWAVTADERRLYRLPGRAALEQPIELLRHALSDPAQGNPDLFAKTAHRLYEMLVAPAEALLKDGRPLIIVPDGALVYVPFEALLTGPAEGAAYGALPYLLRRHAVSYGQSASVLRQLRAERPERRTSKKQLLAFGDPAFAAPGEAGGGSLERLAYSGTEVENIARLFAAGEADVFVREEASEERVKTLQGLDGYRYVHFATHGLIDEKRPDFSSVALAHAGGEDGLLQAAEIFNLRMNADLVVLSACETGIGKMVRGEGMVGLTRAFMYAGTPSIVVSLWRVADLSTAQLMEGFYGGLVTDAAGKAQALRQAKLGLLQEASLAHPFHWAPFILIGDWK